MKRYDSSKNKRPFSKLCEHLNVKIFDEQEERHFIAQELFT